MDAFISEPITPHRGTFDCGPMASGLPGLPAGFDWRGVSYRAVGLLDAWKQSGPEGGRADGERYLRRHYFRLAMAAAQAEDGAAAAGRGGTVIWTVYVLRQASRGSSARRRWFLASAELAEGA